MQQRRELLDSMSSPHGLLNRRVGLNNVEHHYPVILVEMTHGARIVSGGLTLYDMIGKTVRACSSNFGAIPREDPPNMPPILSAIRPQRVLLRYSIAPRGRAV